MSVRPSVQGTERIFHRRGLSLILAVILLAALVPACRGKSESPPVLISINGRAITLEQFRNEFEKTLVADQTVSAEEKINMERSFLVQVIDRELVLAEAERLGITVFGAEVEQTLQDYRRDYPGDEFEQMLQEQGLTLERWRQELEQGLLMEKAVRQVAYADITVLDAEVEDYYRGRRDEFDRPAQVRARQIVVASQEEGQQLLGRLRQGESFIEVAQKHSLSADSENGGDLGFFARGQMPAEFDAAVFTLPVGRISDLVHSEYGFHIFKVEERRAGMRLTLADVREEVREAVRSLKEEQAYQEWLQDLRSRATIEINWALL
jgi:peptidyl-prolyl cis-trans isomerase C